MPAKREYNVCHIALIKPSNRGIRPISSAASISWLAYRERFTIYAQSVLSVYDYDRLFELCSARVVPNHAFDWSSRRPQKYITVDQSLMIRNGLD